MDSGGHHADVGARSKGGRHYGGKAKRRLSTLLWVRRSPSKTWYRQDLCELSDSPKVRNCGRIVGLVGPELGDPRVRRGQSGVGPDDARGGVVHWAAGELARGASAQVLL